MTKYYIKTQTGDRSKAGTDGTVSVQLTGKKGQKSGWLPLDRVVVTTKPDDPFEKGSLDLFSIVTKEDLGELGEFAIKLDYKDTGTFTSDGWYLDWVLLSNTSSTWSSKILVDSWFENGTIKTYPLDAADYDITIKTGNVVWAGTDSDVYVQLTGEQGQETPWIKLDKADYNDFEQNSCASYIVQARKDLGKPTKVSLKVTQKDDWYVEWIRVKKGNELLEAQVASWFRKSGRKSRDTSLQTFPLVPVATYQYNVTIKTGDLPGSGTDGDVDVQLAGKNGKTTAWLRLDKPGNNDFEANGCDTYPIFTDENLGLLDRITVRLTVPKADILKVSAYPWYVEWIRVEGNLYRYADIGVNSWFNQGYEATSGAGDKQKIPDTTQQTFALVLHQRKETQGRLRFAAPKSKEPPTRTYYEITMKNPKGGPDRTIKAPADRSLLHTAQRWGIELPHSCNTGACSSCVVKLASGNAPTAFEHLSNTFLTQEQIQQGYVLACVAFPRANCAIETGVEEQLYAKVGAKA